MAQKERQPEEAHNIPDLLSLIKSEKKQMRFTLDQPALLDEMKANVVKLCEALKFSVDKGAMIYQQGVAGIDDLCPEVSKNVSILTVSVRIINHGLCECAANQLLNASLSVLESIYNVFLFIHRSSTDKADEEKQRDDQSHEHGLATLVGVVWEV